MPALVEERKRQLQQQYIYKNSVDYEKLRGFVNSNIPVYHANNDMKPKVICSFFS